MGGFVSHPADVVVAGPSIEQSSTNFLLQCQQLSEAIKTNEAKIKEFATSRDDSARTILGSKIEIFMEANPQTNKSVQAFIYLITRCSSIESHASFLQNLRAYVRERLNKDHYDIETLSILIAYDGITTDTPHLDIPSNLNSTSEDPREEHYQFSLILSRHGSLGTQYATSSLKPLKLSHVWPYAPDAVKFHGDQCELTETLIVDYGSLLREYNISSPAEYPLGTLFLIPGGIIHHSPATDEKGRAVIFGHVFLNIPRKMIGIILPASGILQLYVQQ